MGCKSGRGSGAGYCERFGKHVHTYLEEDLAMAAVGIQIEAGLERIQEAKYRLECPTGKELSQCRWHHSPSKHFVNFSQETQTPAFAFGRKTHILCGYQV